MVLETVQTHYIMLTSFGNRKTPKLEKAGSFGMMETVEKRYFNTNDNNLFAVVLYLSESS